MMKANALTQGSMKYGAFLGVECLIAASGSGTNLSRQVRRSSDTSLVIFNCVTITTGSGDNKNSYLIPTKICGYK